MPYKAVIFDLDGTLTDTLEDLQASLNHALALSGLPPRSLQEVRRFVGNGIGALVRRAMGEEASGQAYRSCLALFQEHYTLHCYDRTRPYPGVVDTMSELARRGVKQAIVSNKLQAGVDELCRRFFLPHVTAAIGEQEGIRRKPAPDMVREALRRLSLPKEACLYVGDSEVDVQTAANAGLPCASVLWGFRTREELLQAGATLLIHSPSDLLPFF